MGFEPTTACLEGRNSTTELLPHCGERSMFWPGMQGIPLTSVHNVIVQSEG